MRIHFTLCESEILLGNKVVKFSSRFRNGTFSTKVLILMLVLDLCYPGLSLLKYQG